MKAIEDLMYFIPDAYIPRDGIYVRVAKHTIGIRTIDALGGREMFLRAKDVPRLIDILEIAYGELENK